MTIAQDVTRLGVSGYSQIPYEIFNAVPGTELITAAEFKMQGSALTSFVEVTEILTGAEFKMQGSVLTDIQATTEQLAAAEFKMQGSGLIDSNPGGGGAFGMMTIFRRWLRIR